MSERLAAVALPGRWALARWPAVSSAVAVGAWVALLAAARSVGEALYDRDPLIRVGNPPLVGAVDPRLSARLALPIALAGAIVVWGPSLAEGLRWRALLTGVASAAFAWAMLLAASDGLSAISAPLTTRYEYLRAVPLVGSPTAFLSGFVAHLPHYPTHVKGHPPGAVLLLWLLGRIGLGGAGPAAVVFVAGGALAVPAALVAAREVAGERMARRAAPFLVLAPAALWIATSADALFAGVAAVGIALYVVATGRRELRSDALALAAGLVLGAGLFLSYGLATLAPLLVVVAAARRRVRPLLLAAAGVLAVGVAFRAMGFDWLAGLRATHAAYASGVASRRPYGPFLLIDLAAFAVALGPAAAAGLARVRARGLGTLVGGGLLVVALAAVSGLSRGETERIWLPFVPWVLLAAAALRAPRRWLAAQAAVAVALQTLTRSPW